MGSVNVFTGSHGSGMPHMVQSGKSRQSYERTKATTFYTLLQKKCTLISPRSPSDPGSRLADLKKEAK